MLVSIVFKVCRVLIPTEPIPVLVSELFIVYIQERYEGEMLCGDKLGCQMLENLHKGCFCSKAETTVWSVPTEVLGHARRGGLMTRPVE